MSSRRMRPAPRGGCTDKRAHQLGLPVELVVGDPQRADGVIGGHQHVHRGSHGIPVDLFLGVEIEPSLVRSDLPAGHAEAQHRTEQVQARVHPHVGMPSFPVEVRLDRRAWRGRRRRRLDQVQHAATLPFARVGHPPFAAVGGAQHARVAGLATAERIEHRAVEHHARLA